MSKIRIYWDSCTWLGLINEEPNKFSGCVYTLERAQKSEIEILTSAFTLAEVFKTRCEEPHKALAEENDKVIEGYFRQNFIVIASLDEKIAKEARRLLRRHSDVLKKPQDAIHLATALYYNASELHTFDGTDLKPLNGLLENQNGEFLKICTPPQPPPEWAYHNSLLALLDGEPNDSTINDGNQSG